MSSKTRIQNYIRQNKISELFEEMMAKLVKDLPASPIHYLVKMLSEKEKSVKKIVRDTSLPVKQQTPELSSSAKLWATAPTSPLSRKSPITSPRVPKKSTSPRGSTSPSDDQRNYSKPWLSNTRKSPGKPKAGATLSQSTPSGRITSPRTSKEWNKKTQLSKSKNEQKDTVDGGDDTVDLGLVYAKPKMIGVPHVNDRDDMDEIESEIKPADDNNNNVKASAMSGKEAKKSKKLSEKEAKKKRKEELKRLADENKAKVKESSSKKTSKKKDEEEDSALEVLEDADDLIKEGVKDPPKTGFIVNNSGKKAREEIELVLNMSKFFDELGGMVSAAGSQVAANPTSNKNLEDDDDDFESASQVTGPRKPVWEAPESEVESVASQQKSARRSGIGVEMFDVETESKLKTQSPTKETKSDKNKSKEEVVKSRPRTAPSRSDSRDEGNGQETYRVSEAKPLSRHSTPRGSVVGGSSRRQSQTSNTSPEKR